MRPLTFRSPRPVAKAKACRNSDAKSPAVQPLQTHEDSIRDAVVASMEQGVIVWSEDAKCLYCNDRLFTVLELQRDALHVGMSREDYYSKAYDQQEFTAERRQEVERKVRELDSFSFDRRLPSGRTITAATRRLAHGGIVVTFTDVTAAHKAVDDLNAAKKAAEDAEARAKSALDFERKRQGQIQMLSQLGEWLQSCKSLDELYLIVSAHMAQLLPGSSGELYIYSNSRDVLDGACSWNDAKPLEQIRPDDCWSLRRGRSYVYGTGDIAFLCTHVEEQRWNADGNGYFCIPIIAHGDTVGLLHVKAPLDHVPGLEREFSPLLKMRQFAIQCAEQISLAIANVKLRDQLRDQSIRDSLTGLYNRRYLLECMRREIGRARKLSLPMSVISLDADHFKRLNDNHGHDAGDAVLRSVGELMRKMFDGDEVNCRFGGEEFVILLPETSAEAACMRAEALRVAVETMVIRYGDHNLPRVTLSLGVASFPEAGSEPQAILASADTALYRAKNDGRNRVCR